MYIQKVELKNFRNFKEATIRFTRKSLIIGPNEVGKTNLLYALRLLLDKNLSPAAIEPLDTDFNVESSENSFEIFIHFKEVNVDCVLSALKGRISDNEVMILAYIANRDEIGKKTYKILAGPNKENMGELNGRFYLKYLNAEFVKSNRNLENFLRTQKRKIFDDFKEMRSDSEQDADHKTISNIEGSLNDVNNHVGKLSFINKAQSKINTELSRIVPETDRTELGFDIGALDSSEYINRVDLVAKKNGQSVAVGGDGRINQIFLSMWSAQRESSDVEEVTFHCIEEPEAHLHPHNQRTLSSYLYKKLEGQIITTTHSPQIACEFSPNSIIKLYKSSERSSMAASGGCSEIIDQSFEDFSYRLNILPAESFFASCVLLVEGPSEVLFYKALSRALGFELDKLNIGILPVNGIDFIPYSKIFSSLEVPFFVRTDFDVVKTRASKYRFAGFERALKVVTEIYQEKKEDKEVLEKIKNLCALRMDRSEESESHCEQIKQYRKIFEKYYIYLAENDLEWDMINSPLHQSLSDFYNTQDKEELYKKMTKRKGDYMFAYLAKNNKHLSVLKDNSIAKPLIGCLNRVSGVT